MRWRAVAFGGLRALGAGLLLSLSVAGCAENVVTPQPDVDLTGTYVDMGSGDWTGASIYRAAVEQQPYLDWQNDAAGADKWRERKRDATIALAAAGKAQLFFVGSPASGGAWVLGRLAVDPVSMSDQLALGGVQPFGAQAGTWDAGDVSGPAVLTGANVRGRRLAIYYAATGSPDIPAADRGYVSQIGVATTDDPAGALAREAKPLVAVPWLGQVPAMTGPESHGAADPTVVAYKNQLVLFYAGLSCNGNQGCRYSILRRSSPDGVTFGPATPVTLPGAGATGGVAGPSALLVDGKLLLAYSALRLQPGKSRDSVQQAGLSGEIHLAISEDGVKFTAAASPLVSPEGKYRAGAGRPYLYADGAALRMLFNGSPDLNTPAVSVYRATLTR